MVKIRLARQGRGDNKFFKIVVMDEKLKRSGKALDMVGYWQPSKNLKMVDVIKIKEWVAKGAIVTNAVAQLAKEG